MASDSLGGGGSGGVGGERKGLLTKHPPAVLAQDAGQALLALSALMPVGDDH